MSRLFFICIYVCILNHQLYAQKNCDLKIDEEGIQVFLCETEGSPFKSINVNFVVKTTLKKYALGVLDIANYTYWQANIIHPHILEVINNSELVYYCEVETPWPITHRDLIFHLKMRQDPSTKVLTVSLKQLPDYIPNREGIVRIPKASSLLTVTPIDKNYVNVNYVIHIDIGGDVPAFLANLFAAQTPWQTFKNYRERLQSNNVTDADIDFILNY